MGILTMTLIVYLCFFLGLIQLFKAPFKLYRFFKTKKREGFLSGIRNNGRCSGDNSGSGNSSGRTSDNICNDSSGDGNDGNRSDDSHNGIPVINIDNIKC